MLIDLKLFDESELTKIHDYTLKVLQDPGMKILEQRMLLALKKKGAEVCLDSNIVRFPNSIINETIDLLRKDIEEGKSPKYLNGVTCEKTGSSDIQAKFGGACVQFYDWEERHFRVPTESDLISMVKLGEAIPEVKTVGNPVVYLKDRDGNLIDPKMQRIKTAAVVAKYTTKPGPTEVWTSEELDYLIEIGSIVRGSREKYMKDPCFITAKETIAPLILEKKSAEVLLALAEKKLPCIIIPMPISGVSSPVSLFGNIVIGNSEILGTAAAIKTLYPDTSIVGGVISGSMNMATGSANFATPEATLQDFGLAELHERLYGFNFGMGGYLDAKFPDIQNAIEKEFKYLILTLTGRRTYPVGLINWGKCFSPEQAMVDIEIIKGINRFFKNVKVRDEEKILQLIRKVGIGGSFLQEKDTLINYKDYITMSELFDHVQAIDKKIDKDYMMKKSNSKIKKLLNSKDLYQIEKDKSDEIDRIVKRAQEHL